MSTGENVQKWTRYFLIFFSDASERWVWLSAESKILASTFGRFRLYRLTYKILWKKNLIRHQNNSRYFSVKISNKNDCGHPRLFLGLSFSGIGGTRLGGRFGPLCPSVTNRNLRSHAENKKNFTFVKIRLVSLSSAQAKS